MIRDIKIRPVMNGFICEVGCQVVVFGSRGDLVSNLSKYLDNPEAVEKEFRANAIVKEPQLLRGEEPMRQRVQNMCAPEPVPVPMPPPPLNDRLTQPQRER